MPTNNINLTAPTEDSVNALELQRRMALADQLRQASLQSPNNEMVGGVVVKQSPFQGLGRLAQALMAKKMNEENDAKMQQMATLQQQRRQAALDGMGDIDPTIKAALGSSDPFIQQLAKYQLEAKQKAADKQAELTQKATDAKALQAERLAAQAEQAKRDEALRRDLATQHDALVRATTTQKIAAQNEAKTTPKPLPPQALKMRQENLDAIATSSAINADLSAFEKQIDDKKLSFGPTENWINKGKNMIGMSDANSQNFASFMSSLEKLRNDSLRLNSGVQTEGDAQRAWNELFTNLNDTALVKKRLGEIRAINERAVNFRKMNIDLIHQNYGHEPLNTSGYENVAPAIGGGARSSQAKNVTVDY